MANVAWRSDLNDIATFDGNPLHGAWAMQPKSISVGEIKLFIDDTQCHFENTYRPRYVSSQKLM